MENFQIAHTPYDAEKKSYITFDMVDSLYVGQLNCCSCGCGGEYYEASDPANQKRIVRALNEFANTSTPIESIDEYIFDLIRSTKHKSNGELVEKGYRLYLKDEYANPSLPITKVIKLD